VLFAAARAFLSERTSRAGNARGPAPAARLARLPVHGEFPAGMRDAS
jgi:hypothetical protein